MTCIGRTCQQSICSAISLPNSSACVRLFSSLIAPRISIRTEAGARQDSYEWPVNTAVYENQGMSKASSHLPAGFHTLSVHLTVNGAEQYIDFLKRAFNAVELTRSSSPDGRLLNASVRIADSITMLNDLFPE